MVWAIQTLLLYEYFIEIIGWQMWRNKNFFKIPRFPMNRSGPKVDLLFFIFILVNRLQYEFLVVLPDLALLPDLIDDYCLSRLPRLHMSLIWLQILLNLLIITVLACIGTPTPEIIRYFVWLLLRNMLWSQVFSPSHLIMLILNLRKFQH